MDVYENDTHGVWFDESNDQLKVINSIGAVELRSRVVQQDAGTVDPPVRLYPVSADFHALRHTFITNMMKSGVTPKTAQALARHSTIDLTMNVYTSLTVTDQAAALSRLPGVPVFDTPSI